MNPADERRARELGARDYLVKPTRFDAFIATVGAAIERWIETVTAK
jgi:DNA-binding response OmpR family regulator